MRKIIFLFITSLIIISCNDQLINPEYSNSADIDKRGSPELTVEDEIISPRKVYKSMVMTSEYTFNPEAPEGDCGGFLGDCSLKYSYENKNERNLRNVQIYSPSKLYFEGNVYNTYNLYTINRYEEFTEKGVLKRGRTWGEFQIYKIKDPVIHDESGIVKYDKLAENKLKDLGPLLISGEFNGNITGHKTEMRLVGKGSNMFSGASLVASEDMQCSKGMFCWKSKISGKIKKVEYIDE